MKANRLAALCGLIVAGFLLATSHPETYAASLATTSISTVATKPTVNTDGSKSLSIFAQAFYMNDTRSKSNEEYNTSDYCHYTNGLIYTGSSDYQSGCNMYYAIPLPADSVIRSVKAYTKSSSSYAGKEEKSFKITLGYAKLSDSGNALGTVDSKELTASSYDSGSTQTAKFYTTTTMEANNAYYAYVHMDGGVTLYGITVTYD